MTSTINNNDPSVHYDPPLGWERSQRFGGIVHAPIGNKPTAAALTLEFDGASYHLLLLAPTESCHRDAGTGVAVVGFLKSSDHDILQDLLRCAVDTPDIPPPTPLSNAQTSTQLTFCVISPLPSTHHTLRVHPGESANNNPLISGFVVFSNSTTTSVVIAPAPPTQQSGSLSTATPDTSSPPSPTSQPPSSEVGHTSTTTSSSSASPMPMRTSAVNTDSSATNTPSSYGSYPSSLPSSAIKLPCSLDSPHGHQPSGTSADPGGLTIPPLSDTPSQRPRRPDTAAISGGIVGGIVLLLIILVVMLYSRRWLREIGRRSECIMDRGLSVVLILTL